MTNDETIAKILELKEQAGALQRAADVLSKTLQPPPHYPRNKLYPYKKTERFAVASKLPQNKRHRTNLGTLYETKEAAEAIALNAAKTQGGRYYVVEIQSVTNFSKKVCREKPLVVKPTIKKQRVIKVSKSQAQQVQK